MKIIPENVLLGQQGVNLIEKIVLQMGFLWHPSGAIEGGIDGTIELRDVSTGQIFNSVLQVQSKAISELTAETSNSFEYICREKDLEYWLHGNAPVILIVSRPSRGEAYWVSVKDYFADLGRRKTRKVHFDKEGNKFTVESKGELIRTAIPKDVGVYLSPQPKSETVFSNLLQLRSFAPYIYVADTPLRRAWEVFRLQRSRNVRVGSEWELASKRMYSFHDLDADEWNYVCDAGPVERFESREWAFSDINELRNIFVALLNRSLRQMLYIRRVDYHDRWEHFYFRATPDLSPLAVSYNCVKKRATKTVFQGYPRVLHEGQQYSYYRHSGFHGKFKCHETEWYLEITPTYVFTKDGFRRHRYSEEKLKGIKRLERNAAILGQVIMWADLLAAEPGLFLAPYPFLQFGELIRLNAGRGINDKAWLPQEEDSGASWQKGEGEELSLFSDEA